MNILITWFISAFVLVVAAYLLPGVHVDTFMTALALAIVLGLLNVFLKPVLLLFTLPVNILTLGLFTLVINGFLILLAARIVPGFRVDSFWSAFFYSILLSLINIVLYNRK